ncbi:MAG: CdvA-like protein [Promethearchaeota archaeon]
MTWKGFFEKINAELDMTSRKKQALENLHTAGRISQFAYECLNKELTDEIEQVEARRKALAEKMTSKLNELEEQRMALEMFLANTEMAHVAGEIDDEIHAKESSALDLGLEATKQELNWIREVVLQLVPKETETSESQTPVESIEVAAVETDVEKTSEATESVQVEAPVEVTANVSEVKVEEIQAPTEAQPDVETTASEASEDSFRPQSEETQE